MSRPGGKLWAGSDDESSASESEAAVDIGAEQKRQQKRWEIDSDSGACVRALGWLYVYMLCPRAFPPPDSNRHYWHELMVLPIHEAYQNGISLYEGSPPPAPARGPRWGPACRGRHLDVYKHYQYQYHNSHVAFQSIRTHSIPCTAEQTESEDEVRVVRSAKDKAWDEMKEKVGKINNALKINDWTIVEGEFDELSKRIEAKKVRSRLRVWPPRLMHRVRSINPTETIQPHPKLPTRTLKPAGAAGDGRAGRAALLREAAGDAGGQA